MTAEPSAQAAEPQPAQAPPPRRTRFAGWWTPFRATIAFVVALVAFASALLPFLPRVSAEMAPPTDPNNQFSIAATIQNTGYVPLEDVQLAMGLCEINTGPTLYDTTTISKCDGPLKTKMTRGAIWHINHLSMDEKFGISFGDLFNIPPSNTLHNADISLIVSYRPAFSPFRSEKEFGYKSKKRSDGKLEWFYIPRH